MHSTLDEARKNNVAPWTNVATEYCDGLCTAFWDRYPVTKGHLLFVPKFNYDEIILHCFKRAMHFGKQLVAEGECDSYNIGMNTGKSAGQTVMYPHIHLILRRAGDCEDPVGGVRGVIPGQANYHKDTYKEEGK